MFKNNYWKQLIPDLLVGVGVAFLLIGIFLSVQAVTGNITTIDNGQSRLDDEPVAFDPELGRQLLKPLAKPNILSAETADINLEDYSPVPKPVAGVRMLTITIPEGSTGIEVAQIFAESGLIDYDQFLQLLTLFRIETRIKAGDYRFPSNSRPLDILTKILLN